MNMPAPMDRILKAIAVTLLIFGFAVPLGTMGPGIPLAQVQRCDVDRDGDVDRNDISAIFAARNTPASGPDDPRDADGNGLITVNDARGCVLQCTLPNCAVPTHNSPPVADAGSDQNVAVGTLATLNGSGSNDPDNGPNPLIYSWTFVSVPAGSSLTNASIGNPTSAAPSFAPDVAGSYTVNLQVSDGDLTGSDQVVVNAAVPNVPPNADAGPDQNVAVGALATLNGSGSVDPDNGPGPLTFAWTFVSVPAGSGLTNASINNATTAAPGFTPDVAGTYVLNLAVSDGALADSDQVQGIAAVPNVAPNADAGPDQNVRTGRLATLNGGASNDPDNGPGPLTFAWTFVSVPPGSSLTNASITNPTGTNPSFTPDLDGTYVLNLQVSDGALEDSDQTMVVAGNAAPVAADDVYRVVEDAVLNLPAPGVLSNDSDADADPLTAVQVQGPLHGALTLNADGSFTYTPNANFNGTDTFTYRPTTGR